MTQDESVREAVDDILSDERFQTSLPSIEEQQAASDSASWLLGSVFNIVAIVGLIVLAMIALIIVIRLFTDRMESASVGPVEDEEATARSFDIDLDTVRQYAAAGQFAIAIHALLQLTLVELANRAESPPPDSDTSREILKKSSLGFEARAPLEYLIETVEWTHFGSRMATAADFDDAMENHDAFVSAYVGATS